jgi:GNAT superfamily N-acetyltransferase
MPVRTAEIRDAESITAVINAAFRKAEGFLLDDDRIDVESVRSLLGKGKFLVTTEELVGCVYLEMHGDRAYLGLLSVDPKHQGAGLGSLLMNAAEEFCAKSGCRFIDLKIINLRTENHALYRRRGYAEMGTEPFPSHLTPKFPCHFINMTKRLE